MSANIEAENCKHRSCGSCGDEDSCHSLLSSGGYTALFFKNSSLWRWRQYELRTLHSTTHQELDISRHVIRQTTMAMRV